MENQSECSPIFSIIKEIFEVNFLENFHDILIFFSSALSKLSRVFFFPTSLKFLNWRWQVKELPGVVPLLCETMMRWIMNTNVIGECFSSHSDFHQFNGFLPNPTALWFESWSRSCPRISNKERNWRDGFICWSTRWRQRRISSFALKETAFCSWFALRWCRGIISSSWKSSAASISKKTQKRCRGKSLVWQHHKCPKRLLTLKEFRSRSLLPWIPWSSSPSKHTQNGFAKIRGMFVCKRLTMFRRLLWKNRNPESNWRSLRISARSMTNAQTVKLGRKLGAALTASSSTC